MRHHLALLVIAAVAAMPPGLLRPTPVAAQCMPANPSFEIAGTGGPLFAGWNQFGTVGSSSQAEHGAASVRLTGPNLGGWDLSAVWQKLDAVPGERWTAAITAWHTAAKPVMGQSTAILNVEWRDAAGGLISYESHVVVDATTPLDSPQAFEVVTSPAPSGTAFTHYLFGMLQAPSDPQPEVHGDLVRFEPNGPPTPEENQWADFPGGRSISFAGRSWRVKGPGFYGPGGSLFCDSSDCVRVDSAGALHMSVQEIGGAWQSTEVALEEVLGYGDYVFTTRGKLDDFDPQIVLGLFLWEYGTCYAPELGWWGPYNEIDVEFSKWGDPFATDVGQFVVQPYDWPGNLQSFDHTFAANEVTSHAFLWQADRVEFRSWVGGPFDEASGNPIAAWTYTGPHVPRPGRARVHVNLWQLATPASPAAVVLENFHFMPEGLSVSVPAAGAETDPARRRPAIGATPNPFRANTNLSFEVPKKGPVSVEIFSITGRRLRSLAGGFHEAGSMTVGWDGRDSAGRPMPSGVYLLHIQTLGQSETRRLVLLR